MRTLFVSLILLICLGCSPNTAQRFGVGDKVVVPNKQLGVIIGVSHHGSVCWTYNIQTRGGTVELWDTEKDSNIQMYEPMDWNKLETCPLPVQAEVIPPEPAPKVGKKTAMYDFPAIQPSLKLAIKGEECLLG